MKKPLQQTNEFIESFKNSFAARQGHLIVPYKIIGRGEILFRNTGDVGFLIETANRHLKASNAREHEFLARLGYALSVWMEKFVTNGFTSPMLQELRRVLGDIRFFHVLNPAIPTRGKPLPHWDYVADTEDFIDPKTMAAYAFSQQLTLDGFAGLMRCQMKDCKQFFIGRTNSKWCSKTCGSLYRVRQKRKKDKT